MRGRWTSQRFPIPTTGAYVELSFVPALRPTCPDIETDCAGLSRLDVEGEEPSASDRSLRLLTLARSSLLVEMRLRERPVASILRRSSSLLSFSSRAKASQCFPGQLSFRGQRLHGGTWLGEEEEEKHVRISRGEDGREEVRSRGDLSAINFDLNGYGRRDDGARPTPITEADDSTTCRRVSSTGETIWKRRRFEPSSPSPSSAAATSSWENSGPRQSAAIVEETWRLSLSPSSLTPPSPPLSGRGCKNSWEDGGGDGEGWVRRWRRAEESAAGLNPAKMGPWHGGRDGFFSLGIGGRDRDRKSLRPVAGADLRRLVGIAILNSRHPLCRGHRCAAADAEAAMERRREEGKEEGRSGFRPSSFVHDLRDFSRQAAADYRFFFAGRNSDEGGDRERRKGHGFSLVNYWRGNSDDVADGPARPRRGGVSMVGLGPSSFVKGVSPRHSLCGNHAGSGSAATCLSWANFRGYATKSGEEKDALRQSYGSDGRERGGGLIRENGTGPGLQDGICSSGVVESDGTIRGWFERNCPAKIWPYIQLARLDRPIGTWLLTWPCFWSISLAAPPGTLPDLKMLALFGIGAILLRGAGCTVNDLLDRDIDRKVSRTSNRPLASGAVTQNQGVVFLGSQLLLGLGILLQLNQFSQILGASSLLLVGTYPLMKRYTYWPQAYLGLTINWGALFGWAAVSGSLDPFIVTPLYFSCFAWTVFYDTIYAHQDKVDDVRVGVKSTALRFGEATPMWLTGFSGATIGGLICVGKIAGLGWGFYPALVLASSHLAWQTQTVDLNNRADCLAKFVSNKWFGGIVFAGTVLGKLTA